jgi:hypothetical protein
LVGKIVLDKIEGSLCCCKSFLFIQSFNCIASFF